MNILTILIIVVLLILVVGGLPNHGFITHGYGYGPSGLFGLIVVVLIVLLLLGRL